MLVNIMSINNSSFSVKNIANYTGQGVWVGPLIVTASSTFEDVLINGTLTVIGDTFLSNVNISGNLGLTGTNVLIGEDAGITLITDNNVHIGYEAGKLTTGAQSTSIGSGAMGAGTGPADDCVAIGYHSLNMVTVGNDNIAIGSISGQNVTTGSKNIILGSASASSLVEGGDNIFIGDNSDTSLSSVIRSIAIGIISSVGGNESCAIGYNAISNFTNAVALGSNTTARANNVSTICNVSCISVEPQSNNLTLCGSANNTWLNVYSSAITSNATAFTVGGSASAITLGTSIIPTTIAGQTTINTNLESYVLPQTRGNPRSTLFDTNGDGTLIWSQQHSINVYKLLSPIIIVGDGSGNLTVPFDIQNYFKAGDKITMEIYGSANCGADVGNLNNPEFQFIVHSTSLFQESIPINNPIGGIVNFSVKATIYVQSIGVAGVFLTTVEMALSNGGKKIVYASTNINTTALNEWFILGSAGVNGVTITSTQAYFSIN